jgi:hypothetical protein
MRSSLNIGVGIDGGVRLASQVTQSEPFHAAIEIGSVGLQDSCGFGDIVVGLCKRLLDQLALKPLKASGEGYAAIDGCIARRVHPTLACSSKNRVDGGSIDGRAGSKNRQPLDHVE